MAITLYVNIVLTVLILGNIQVSGRHIKRQVNHDISRQSDSYLLPAASTNVLKSKQINNNLVCAGPGLFADVNNNCQIFHMCHVTERADGSGYDLRQYSFFCGNNTIFDQYTLTCQVPEKAIPCEYAPEFYPINQRIMKGEKHVQIHRYEDRKSLGKYYEKSRNRKWLSKTPATTESTTVASTMATSPSITTDQDDDLNSEFY